VVPAVFGELVGNGGELVGGLGDCESGGGGEAERFDGVEVIR